MMNSDSALTEQRACATDLGCGVQEGKRSGGLSDFSL